MIQFICYLILLIVTAILLGLTLTAGYFLCSGALLLIMVVLFPTLIMFEPT